MTVEPVVKLALKEQFVKFCHFDCLSTKFKMSFVFFKYLLNFQKAVIIHTRMLSSICQLQNIFQVFFFKEGFEISEINCQSGFVEKSLRCLVKH